MHHPTRVGCKQVQLYTYIIQTKPRHKNRQTGTGSGRQKDQEGTKNETEKQNHFGTVLLASGSISPYSSRVTSWSKFSVPPLPLLTFTTQSYIFQTTERGDWGTAEQGKHNIFDTSKNRKKSPSAHVS